MKVSFFQDKTGSFVKNHPDFMIRLGSRESKNIRAEIDQIKIEKPIFITGLARSGTTILLEKLSENSDTVSYRYKDFPLVHIPYWWHNFLKRAGAKGSEKVERAHKDRIKISPDSPEAIEEMLWMSFFRDSHTLTINNILDQDAETNTFADFYKDTIKKIILSRNGKRYLAKNNYNISRIKLITKIFQDAKIIIAVRNPVDTIASLIKQHKLFVDAERNDPKILTYMQNLGHFEFGLDRRPINFSDNDLTAEIDRLLKNDNINGYIKYWNAIYNYVYELLRDSSLKQNILLINYDDLCSDAANTLREIYKFCELSVEESKIIDQANSISAPTYYKHGFTKGDLDLINTATKSVRDKLSINK